MRQLNEIKHHVDLTGKHFVMYSNAQPAFLLLDEVVVFPVFTDVADIPKIYPEGTLDREYKIKTIENHAEFLESIMGHDLLITLDPKIIDGRVRFMGIYVDKQNEE